MEINGIDTIGQQISYLNDAKEANNRTSLPVEDPNNNNQKSRETGTNNTDKVSISDTSREMQLAMKAVSETPDVRTDRVNELKNSINEGTYQVNAQLVAGKMLGGIINELI
ncbi:MAG: flagellar biosynthesis anti-sigma factor FlgM [Desulfobacterales bacterium]|nr:flagellar biosynthesis anti-sigma factor FlgM [Desulfobacterales bacterium]